MKKIMLMLFMLTNVYSLIACPVCERNKPKILRGITHGSNPESNWDYIIVAVIAIIAILTLIYSIKWLIKPNESNKEHIKYTILNDK